MTMARIVSVAVLCISLCSALAGQATIGEAAAERRITDTLHQMYEAEKRRDLKFVLSRLAGDFAEVAGNGGVYHRADVEAEWSNVALHDYKLSDCPLRRAPYLLETSLPGVFAVGDIRAESVKRVASAVGEGSMVVQFVHKVLAE